MDTLVLNSTLLLTVLLLVGLFFFVKASTKERQQQARFITDEAEASLSQQLQQYFTKRAYRVINLDPEQE
jgi:Tfp pilus assembly protein PilN